MMTGEQIKKTDLMKLVKRLQEIDSKLCPETCLDVSEYNLLIEEIWNMISDNKKEKVLKRRKIKWKNTKKYQNMS